MDKLRFLHIQKTGGTSFVDLLHRIYRGYGKQFETYDGIAQALDKYHHLSPAERQKIVLVYGHAPLNTGEPEIDNLPTITLLRNPIDRVKSFCQHVREGKSDHLIERFPPDRFDLDEFLASGNRELSNLVTGILVGDNRCQVHIHDESVLIEQARQVLENQLLAFGIMEYYDESLLLFKKQLDWPWPYYRKLNVKKKSQLIEFNEHQMEQIRRMNQVDMRIYEMAREIFERRRQENRTYLDENLPLFRSRQASYMRMPRPIPRLYDIVRYRLKRINTH